MSVFPYVIAGFLGTLVGVAELVSRYKDGPATLFGVPSAWLYGALNAGASAVTLYLAQAFDWTVGNSATSRGTMQVIASGTVAMVILRSSFLNLKIDGKVVPIGPSVLLTAMLTAADRGVDRVRARSRSEAAARIMQHVSFEKARVALPTYCLGLLQNASSQEQQDLRAAIDALASGDMTDRQKSLALGLLLMNLVGPAALESAVEALSEEILPTVRTADAVAPVPVQREADSSAS